MPTCHIWHVLIPSCVLFIHSVLLLMRSLPPSSTPPQCGGVFTMEQVVPLNVGEAEEKALREAMEDRRQQAKRSKVRKVWWSYLGIRQWSFSTSARGKPVPARRPQDPPLPLVLSLVLEPVLNRTRRVRRHLHQRRSRNFLNPPLKAPLGRLPRASQAVLLVLQMERWLLNQSQLEPTN